MREMDVIMYISHINSVFSEETTLIDWVPYPQYVHQVSDGGMRVTKGIVTMPAALTEYVLRGEYNASPGTAEHIQKLLEQKHLRVGLVLAAGSNKWTGFDSAINKVKSPHYPVNKIMPLGITQVLAGQIASKLGEFDYIASDSTSCISGHMAWHQAQMLIDTNYLDAVVVISVDNGISEDYLLIFGENNLSKLSDDDKNPNKFRLGHGCNITVFESDISIGISGNEPIGEILDIGVSAELHSNPMGISNSGDGYRKAIRRLSLDYEVDFVKTHNTFSRDNVIELEVVQELLDPDDKMRIVSYKNRIGHTMGASTAIETALALTEESGTFISMGAGMGNVFSAVAVRSIK